LKKIHELKLKSEKNKERKKREGSSKRLKGEGGGEKGSPRVGKPPRFWVTSVGEKSIGRMKNDAKRI